MNGEIVPSEKPPEAPPPFPPQLVERMLTNQAHELQLRAQELAIQQQQDSNAFEFGKQALTAKVADRKDQRAHEKSLRRSTYIFAGVVILIIVTLIGYALH